ncbi:MAG TPA: 3-hydroxyacyl-CoA dehydrogenase NAD-binding domain-containing protein [Nevskiaceae bacterium]|nr:3-hydroxyacyl-CoA dehydrogenase NAD-binding domain-containing protein [Nevskiaceae bacterium]
MPQTQWTAHGDVAVITFDNPPVNGLGHGLRQGITEGVQRALKDDSIHAIVLTGTRRAFSGGADIREFNTPAASAAPDLRRAIEIIEGATKPVIAAIQGLAMGGGLELALGCHYRLAQADALIAFPEVKLGILPGAGGTQRLPRLIPLDQAATLITTGKPVRAKRLAGTRMFAAVVDGDVVEAAIKAAHEIAAQGGARPRARDGEVIAPANAADQGQAFLSAQLDAVRTQRPHEPAPASCLEALQAAIDKPFDAGMQRERELFVELVESPESKALRHAFFGERAAGKIADLPADTPKRAINTAAVIGAGTMGGGIAMNFANAGIPVTLVEVKQAALDRGLATIRKNYERTASKGRMTQADVEKRMGLIRPTLRFDDAGQADIVIEAVFEDMGVKEQVFKTLDATMKPGAILASNTSTLDVNRIAAGTKRPQDVIGTHFFSPANVMHLLEIVRGAKTGKDVLATALALAKRIGKLGVVAGVCDGFIGNRMIAQYSRQASLMLDEGALPQQVDHAIEAFGFKMGPFRMGDLAGNDIGWAIRKRHAAEHPEVPYQTVSADRLCELGRFGQKTGKGWYDYQPGDRTAHPSAEVDTLIKQHSADLGITRRAIDDQEIVDRLVYALVNEGARILEEGIADKASDIDMVYLNGYGFPPFRGGPMFYADTRGLKTVVARMAQFAKNPAGDTVTWTPAPLLARLAAHDARFNG